MFTGLFPNVSTTDTYCMTEQIKHKTELPQTQIVDADQTQDCPPSQVYDDQLVHGVSWTFDAGLHHLKCLRGIHPVTQSL